MHIVLRARTLLASEATTVSKQHWWSDLTSDLKSVTSITYVSMFWAHFEAPLVASETTRASKQPQRSNLASDLEFMSQTANATMFVWAVKALSVRWEKVN